MPRVNLYVRNEDWDKYQAIESKAEWLHEHLNIPGPMPVMALENISAGQYGIGYVGKPNKENNGLCEHFQPKGQCLVKGCKYGK